MMDGSIAIDRFDALAMNKSVALEYAREPRFPRLRARLASIVGYMGDHPHAVSTVIVAFAFLTLLVTPYPAHAGWIEDGIAAIGDFFGGLFISIAAAILNSSMEIISKIAGDSLFTGSFDELLGTSDQNFAYYAVTVADNTVRVCANTVLAIVIMVQLVKIASQIDRGGGTLPAVRDVFQLFVFMAIFIFLVNHASELMQGIFDLVNAISVAINNLLGSRDAVKDMEFVADASNDVAQGFVMMIVAAVCFLGAICAFVLAKVMLYARAITIYILTMFSPLAFAFLGLDVTKQWGIGFLKNFIAEALSGTVMLVIIWCFPILVSAFMPDGNSVSLAGQTIFLAIDILACCATLIFMLFRSGAIAQKILGGA